LRQNIKIIKQRNFIYFSEFVYRRTRGAPYLTEFHKLQRYLWCRRHRNTNFYNYIFADETTVRLLDIPLYHSRKRASRPSACPSSAKIRAKINIWAGISYHGATPLIVSTDT
jgi:hypothetical protein